MATIELNRNKVLTWILVCGAMLIWTRPWNTEAVPTPGRFVRSCGHHLHYLILEACNKNHKRSPIIVNIIFAQYYVPQDVKSGYQKNPQGTVIIHESLRSDLLDPLHSPWVLEHEVSGDRNQGDMDSNAAVGLMNVYRELARRAPGRGEQILQKCCSSGCTEADFVDHCF